MELMLPPFHARRCPAATRAPTPADSIVRLLQRLDMARGPAGTYDLYEKCKR